MGDIFCIAKIVLAKNTVLEDGQMPRRSRKALANPTGLLPIEGTMKYPHKVVRIIHNPSNQLLFDRSLYLGECLLRCPICGDSFSHALGVYTQLGTDESEGLYRGSYLVARECGERRDAIAVRVQGETCQHRWEIVFQQHKGNTFIRINVLEDGPVSGDGKERKY